MKKFSIVLFILLGFINLKVSAKWFQQKTIFSKALQQEKTYYVGLPVGYNPLDTTTKYPVIIFLHGASVTATEMVNTIEPFLDNIFTKIFFDNLFRVIFVIPDGSCEPYKGSFYTNSALYGNYEDYIVNDMREEIKSNYHTYNYREKWCMMGHSMGGYGAMKIALKYPENFIGVSSLSGPLNITYFEDLLPVILSEHDSKPPYKFSYSGDVTKLVYSMAGAFSPNPGFTPPVLFPIDSTGAIIPSVMEMWEKHNPINLIREWKGNPPMAIHTYCGEMDEFKLAKPNQMFSDTLDKYHLQHTYYQDPNGDHVNSLFTSFPQGLNFLYHVMDTAQIHVATFVENSIAANTSTVFPNPAKDRIYVSGTTKNLLHIRICNLLGEKVIQIENPLINEGLDISKLGQGVYLVSLEFDSGNTSTIRLIKN